MVHPVERIKNFKLEIKSIELRLLRINVQICSHKINVLYKVSVCHIKFSKKKIKNKNIYSSII